MAERGLRRLRRRRRDAQRAPRGRAGAPRRGGGGAPRKPGPRLPPRASTCSPTGAQSRPRRTCAVPQAALARPGAASFPFVDADLGMALFRAGPLCRSAARCSSRYARTFHGSALLAQTTLHAGLAAEMTGDRRTAEAYYARVRAARDYDTDKAAVRDAEARRAAPMTPAQRTLLLGRNAYDSNRLDAAIRILQPVLTDASLPDAARAEAAYRTGRAYQALKQRRRGDPPLPDRRRPPRATRSRGGAHGPRTTSARSTRRPARQTRHAPPTATRSRRRASTTTAPASSSAPGRPSRASGETGRAWETGQGPCEVPSSHAPRLIAPPIRALSCPTAPHLRCVDFCSFSRCSRRPRARRREAAGPVGGLPPARRRAGNGRSPGPAWRPGAARRLPGERANGPLRCRVRRLPCRCPRRISGRRRRVGLPDRH